MLSRFLKKTKTVASLLSLQLPNTHLHCIKVCPWFCILCTSFPTFKDTLYLITLFEIFIFGPKIQLWFPEKIVDYIWVKNSWKCCGFGLFSCWQLWFHEKKCQKNLERKTRENLSSFVQTIFGYSDKQYSKAHKS